MYNLFLIDGRVKFLSLEITFSVAFDPPSGTEYATDATVLRLPPFVFLDPICKERFFTQLCCNTNFIIFRCK